MKRLSHDTGMQIIALIAIVFAASQWGSEDIRFALALILVGLIAFLAGRRERRRPKPPPPDCEYCNDTGMTPGADHGNLITLPAPCTHCDRGAEAATRIRDAVKEMGGIPPAGLGFKSTVEAGLANALTAKPPSDDGFWEGPRNGETERDAAYRQGVREAVEIVRIDAGLR